MLWARWTDPSRHLPYYRWRPAYRGVTEIPINVSTLDPGWARYVANGVSNWNLSNANVRFVPDLNSFNNVVIVAGITGSIDGLGLGIFRPQNYTRYGELREYFIHLSSVGIEAHVRRNSGYTFGNVVENVMTHELGHAIGLRDGDHTHPYSGHHTNELGGSPDGSIMNHNRSRNIRRVGTYQIPTSFDIISVNMIYGHNN